LPSFIAKKEIMAITFQQLFFITFSPLNLSRNYADKTPANCWWFIVTLFWLQKLTMLKTILLSKAYFLCDSLKKKNKKIRESQT
jgi:hypothetical protein